MKALTKGFIRRRATTLLKHHKHRATKSRVIMLQVAGLPFIQADSSVLLYYSKDSEVDTTYLIKHYLSQKKEVFLPFVDKIKIGRIEKYKDLIQGPFDIFIPNNEVTKEFTPDIIILTGLGFDKIGNRVGYGSGWYDRYLEQIDRERSIVIGVCFDNLLYKNIPTMVHDQQVDWVVTEKRIVNCR